MIDARVMYIEVPEEELEHNVSIFPKDPEAVKAGCRDGRFVQQRWLWKCDGVF